MTREETVGEAMGNQRDCITVPDTAGKQGDQIKGRRSSPAPRELVATRIERADVGCGCGDRVWLGCTDSRSEGRRKVQICQVI